MLQLRAEETGQWEPGVQGTPTRGAPLVESGEMRRNQDGLLVGGEPSKSKKARAGIDSKEAVELKFSADP